VIGPVKVVRAALQDAASIAGLLIAPEAMVAPIAGGYGFMTERYPRFGRVEETCAAPEWLRR
jgi:hypothetical protein